MQIRFARIDDGYLRTMGHRWNVFLIGRECLFLASGMTCRLVYGYRFKTIAFQLRLLSHVRLLWELQIERLSSAM